MSGSISASDAARAVRTRAELAGGKPESLRAEIRLRAREQRHGERDQREASARDDRARARCASSRQPVAGLRHVRDPKSWPHREWRLGREEVDLAGQLTLDGARQRDGPRAHSCRLALPRANESNDLERAHAAVCRRGAESSRARTSPAPPGTEAPTRYRSRPATRGLPADSTI